jgi:chromatin remodeling complex protein RSC6
MTKRTQKSSTKKQTVEPVIEKPVIEKPVNDEPVNDEPVNDEPVVNESIIETSKSTKIKSSKSSESLSSDTENPVTNYINKFSSFVEKISVINKELKELGVVGKNLEKDFNQIIKVMAKNRGKPIKSNDNRPLSGFAMPTYLSDELYNFLNIEKGTKVPRKDVTKMINEYIKTNSLRDEDDRRKIIPNEELHKIFNSEEGQDITYFNLQKYMKHHFIKELTV